VCCSRIRRWTCSDRRRIAERTRIRTKRRMPRGWKLSRARPRTWSQSSTYRLKLRKDSTFCFRQAKEARVPRFECPLVGQRFPNRTEPKLRRGRALFDLEYPSGDSNNERERRGDSTGRPRRGDRRRATGFRLCRLPAPSPGRRLPVRGRIRPRTCRGRRAVRTRRWV